MTASRWAEWLKKIPEGEAVYDSVQSRAEGAKAILQIAVGILFLLILIIELCIHWSETLSGAADRALIIIGVALAFSAVVELAYTFFTDGPDEAIDPLILGISSFALIRLSTGNPKLNNVALPVSLLALAVFVLFVARRFLLEVRKKSTTDPR